MFGAIKSLFSVDNLVDKVAAGADAAFYTSQEKAGGFQLLLKLYEPFKIAQRLLALTFCIPYALMLFFTWLLSFWLDVSVQKEMLQGDITIIVGIIVAFYFGGGAVEGVLKSRLPK